MLLEYAQRRPVMVDGESIVFQSTWIICYRYDSDTGDFHERKVTRPENPFLKISDEELNWIQLSFTICHANLPEFVELL